MTPMEKLEEGLGHRFRDRKLLAEALTHPSGKRIPGQASAYERLEFLGDRVLSLLVAEWLYEIYPTAHEGELARRHADLVSRESVAHVSQALDLFDALIVSSAERLSLSQDGGRGRHSALANAGESLIAALYLECGLDATRLIIRRLWQPLIEHQSPQAPRDAKSSLQEWAQGRGHSLPIYELISQDGPPHAPRYLCRVILTGYEAQGEGPSKQAAQQAAATAAMAQIKGTSDK